jgi:hypothetical protein
MTAFYSSNRRIDKDIKVLVGRNTGRTVLPSFVILPSKFFLFHRTMPLAFPVISDFLSARDRYIAHPTKIHQLEPINAIIIIIIRLINM